MAYIVKFSVTRPNTSIPWEDSNPEKDPYALLFEADKREITTVPIITSEDQLTSTVTWIAPDEETWNQFARDYIYGDSGSFDGSNLIERGLTYNVEKYYE